MNPIAVLTIVTSAWHFIPEERRKKYVEKAFDIAEDLAAGVGNTLRRRKQVEVVDTEEEHF